MGSKKKTGKAERTSDREAPAAGQEFEAAEESLSDGGEGVAGMEGLNGEARPATAEPDPSLEPEVAELEPPSPEGAIEALTTELAELEDRHLRLAAEYDNFRKRTMRERAQQSVRAQADLVKSMLESLDDLRRVSTHGSTDHDAAAILEGVQLVEQKLRRVLESFGLKPIEAVGQPFDPRLHEALVTVATEKPEEDEIVSQEVATGYLFKDTLLRPSLVQVKKYQPGAGVEDGSGEAENDS